MQKFVKLFRQQLNLTQDQVNLSDISTSLALIIELHNMYVFHG